MIKRFRQTDSIGRKYYVFFCRLGHSHRSFVHAAKCQARRRKRDAMQIIAATARAEKAATVRAEKLDRAQRAWFKAACDRQFSGRGPELIDSPERGFYWLDWRADWEEDARTSEIYETRKQAIDALAANAIRWSN